LNRHGAMSLNNEIVIGSKLHHGTASRQRDIIA
jgi:hypothetical protein